MTNWLKGKLFAMLIVFNMTAKALAVIGTPMLLVWAFITGIFIFTPNFGPLISMIPALLIAMTLESGTAPRLNQNLGYEYLFRLALWLKPS